MVETTREANGSGCLRCGGQLFPYDEEEEYCLQCGWVKYSTSQPLPERTPPIQKITRICKGGHYSRVVSMLEEIKVALENGNGIRKTAREFDIAVNTIRRIKRGELCSVVLQKK